MALSIQLDELAGLCEEIAALSRADMPLEKAFAIKENERLGECFKELGRKMESGASLAEAVQECGMFPAYYSRVIKTGLISNNLSGVLDNLASLARQIGTVRLFVMRAFLYPMILFTFSWFLLSGIFFFLLPIYPRFYDAFDFSCLSILVMNWFDAHECFKIPLAIGPPILIWTVYFSWCRLAQRSNAAALTSGVSIFCCVPFIGTVVSEFRKELFIRDLILLLESSVPLPQALDLIGPKNIRDKKYYERVIRWVQGVEGQSLLRGLHALADDAAFRAEIAMNRCENLLPAIVIVAVAVILGFCYCFVVEWPYFHLINLLSGPMIQ